MSIGRILLAGIVGGIIAFVWGAAVHMGLPPSVWGIKSLPHDETLVPAMKQAITEDGFYFFPGKDVKDKSKAAEDAWTAKMNAGPTGVLVYHAQGSEPMSVKQLGIEFFSNAAAAMFLAVILGCASASLARGAGLGLLAGVFGWLSIEVSYWNWYGFPDSMTFCTLLEQGGGWLFAGAAIGVIVKRRSAAASSS